MSRSHVVRCIKCNEVVNHSDENGPYFATPLPCSCTCPPDAIDAPDPDNVVPIPGTTRLPTCPQEALRGAYQQGLTEVIIIGREADGTPYYAATQALDSTQGSAMWALVYWRLVEFQEQIKLWAAAEQDDD